MSNEPVPFLDLITPHRELETELVEAFREALRAAETRLAPFVRPSLWEWPPYPPPQKSRVA